MLECVKLLDVKQTLLPHITDTAEKWWVIKRTFETFYYFLVAVF